MARRRHWHWFHVWDSYKWHQGIKGQVAFLWAKFLKSQVKGYSQQWLLEELPPQRALPGCWKNELAQAWAFCLS